MASNQLRLITSDLHIILGHSFMLDECATIPFSPLVSSTPIHHGWKRVWMDELLNSWWMNVHHPLLELLVGLVEAPNLSATRSRSPLSSPFPTATILIIISCFFLAFFDRKSRSRNSKILPLQEIPKSHHSWWSESHMKCLPTTWGWAHSLPQQGRDGSRLCGVLISRQQNSWCFGDWNFPYLCSQDVWMSRRWGGRRNLRCHGHGRVNCGRAGRPGTKT